MVRCFRKRKSCCHEIAIPQARIAAPTLTVMQGFQAKKRLLRAFPFPVLHTASTLRIRLFHMFATQARIESGCDGWKANVLTTILCSSQHCNDKMSYLNQMYEKKAICRQRGRMGKGVGFTTTMIEWSGFNPHPSDVVASLDKTLYDDYLCLVASNKQQVQ